jgi:exosortase/archaeosortase family protein
MAARNPATPQNLTGREARRAIKELRRRLEDVPQETPDENLAQHGAALTELLSWAENLREIRIQELRDRLVKRRAMAGSWGPRVKLVWSSQAGTADVGQAAADSEDPPKPKRFTFSIVPDCGALEAIAIFVAAVLVFPASFVKRLIGIALGVPLLYLVNLGRLTCLAVIGALTPGAQWFDFSHKYVWQGVYVIFVVVFWLLWVEFIVGRKKSE